MQYYGEFNFWEEQVRPQLPDLDSAEAVFARRNDKEEFMAIVDPLVPEHNIAKSTHRVVEFQDLMKAASHAAMTDCTCMRHKVDECLLYPYKRKLLRFTDQNHSLLSKIFAAAISHNQSHCA
eukprot:TRINITY_DN16610_c0_g1_i9.p3 TRINITY_DN16610_c0_g1~~TRINITY_DN16610_c0_g1_i9.p3  ORF type:complete len:122 (-),score=32.55 TRINITY_DN16610_c0_g1_i9:111-476(-)